jgi:HlyD family secretion protein
MTRDLKRFLWVPFVAIAVFAVASIARAPAVEVDTATVEQRDLQVTIDEEGRTRVRERFVVSAPVNGILERVQVRVGDAVKQGDVIAAIRAAAAPPLDRRTEAQLRARAEAAEDDLQRVEAARNLARSELAQAKADATRATSLATGGAMSVAQAELSVTRLRTAEQAEQAAAAAVRLAEHARDEARAALLAPTLDTRGATVRLRAPATAAVLRVIEEDERVVSAGTPILELGDPRSLEIIADLVSSDAVRVQPGASVLLENWGGDQSLRGVVRRVEPSTFTKVSALGVEEQRANVIIDFDCAHEQLVGDGYAIDVRIVVLTRPQVLVVPLGALVRTRDGWMVYVIDDDGRARARRVEPGARAAFDVEARSGLGAGERVVLFPADRVTDGTRVAPIGR